MAIFNSYGHVSLPEGRNFCESAGDLLLIHLLLILLISTNLGMFRKRRFAFWIFKLEDMGSGSIQVRNSGLAMEHSPSILR